MSFIAAAKQEKANEAQNALNSRSTTVTRYIFTPYIDAVIPALNSMGGRIPKGEIVPIYRPWKMVNLRKENVDWNNADKSAYQRLKDPRTRKDTDLAKQYFSPADVCDWVGSEYAGTGAVEIKSLAGMDIDDFEKLKLNEVLLNVRGEDHDTFPTAASYYEQFGRVRTKIEAMREKFPDRARAIESVLVEMEKSVKEASTFARRNAEEANNQMQAQEIRRYDLGQVYAFQFSGVTKRDEALNDLAKLQNEAAKAMLNPSAAAEPVDIKALMAGMLEMAKQMAAESAAAAAKAAVEAVRAESAPATPAPVAEKPEPTKRRAPFTTPE